MKNRYFDLLEDTLKKHNLLYCPAQIYNVDESGIPLDPKAPNVVAKTGMKKVRYRATGRKGQITIVALRGRYYHLPFCLMLRRCDILGQPMNFLVLLMAAVTKAGYQQNCLHHGF